MPSQQEHGHRPLPSQAYSFDFLCSEFWFGLILGILLGWAISATLFAVGQ